MTFTNQSTAIAEANTSQQALAANGSRSFYYIQNCSNFALYVGIGTAATKTDNAIVLRTCEYLNFTKLPTAAALHVLGSVAGQKFTVLEA